MRRTSSQTTNAEVGRLKAFTYILVTRQVVRGAEIRSRIEDDHNSGLTSSRRNKIGETEHSSRNERIAIDSSIDDASTKRPRDYYTVVHDRASQKLTVARVVGRPAMTLHPCEMNARGCDGLDAPLPASARGWRSQTVSPPALVRYDATVGQGLDRLEIVRSCGRSGLAVFHPISRSSLAQRIRRCAAEGHQEEWVVVGCMGQGACVRPSKSPSSPSDRLVVSVYCIRTKFGKMKLY